MSLEDDLALQGAVEHVRARLTQLDATNPAHCASVLHAITVLVKTYIVPSMDVAQIAENGEAYFSLNDVVGHRISGLALGALFDPRFPDLQKPSDDVLNHALQQIDIDLSDRVHRDTFFRCWAAHMAVASCELLFGFLREKPQPSHEVADAEISEIEDLLSNPLPQEIRYEIVNTISALSIDRARSLRERTRDVRIANTLDQFLRIRS